ncbi:MAG: holo-ACP synthase [Silvanigrellaceae bacterium]
MKIRIGTDIVAVDRIEKSIAKESFLRKVFHPTEIDYCQSKARPAASFAARFAAKEAFFKALGTGLYVQGMGPQDVWIENTDNGRPSLKLSPAAEKLISSSGTTSQHDVSLAHDGNFATATVVILAVPSES